MQREVNPVERGILISFSSISSGLDSASCFCVYGSIAIAPSLTSSRSSGKSVDLLLAFWASIYSCESVPVARISSLVWGGVEGMLGEVEAMRRFA